jgi:C-terminal processing protease CtpA/Prc
MSTSKILSARNSGGFVHAQLVKNGVTVVGCLLLSSIACCSPGCFAGETVPEQLERTFSTDYGPAEYKRALFGWNLSEQMRKVRENQLSKRSILDFFGALHDLHSRPIFRRSEAVWLGIHIKKTDSGYLVAWLDPQIKTNLKIGDRVVEFDGSAIEEAVVSTREKTQWYSTPAFEQNFAERFLTYRASSDWATLPEKNESITLTVLREGIKAPLKASLTWLDDEEHAPSIRCPLWGKTKNGYLPNLGRITWEAAPTTSFRSYVFQHGNKSYGFIRFHTYAMGAEERLKALSDVDEAISKFLEHNVQGVVLDQTGNAGGHFLFAYSLLSRLVKAPMRTPLQQYVMRNGEVVGFGKISEFEKKLHALSDIKTDDEAAKSLSQDSLFRNELNFIPQTAATVNDFREFLDFFIEDQKRNAEPHLTAPHFQVQKWIPPCKGPRYTGPIVMLIDEIDFSAAEYAAAIMKDNKCAVLVGVCTAGGGGDQRVQKIDDPHLAGFTYTITFGERVSKDGNLLGPIENVGVSPNFEYRISKQDLMSNFLPLKQNVMRRLEAIEDFDHKAE